MTSRLLRLSVLLTILLAAACTNSAKLDGARVRVLGLWSGPEFESFEAVKSRWEKDSGGVVDWTGTSNVADVLAARTKAGDPPDIVILPNLGLMRQLADEGSLVPLESVLDMERVDRDYARTWRDLGSRNGKLYGIFYKVTNKATVWYNPKAFAAAGYRTPRTWQDLIALADTMVADGRTPFSVVAASGPATGWPLTDWISEIVLNKCGPDLYDKWVEAEIPWTDPCVAQSFRLFTQIVRTKGYALGGSRTILSTTDAEGGDPLYTDPPQAYLYYLASFAQAFIASKYPKLEPGRDYSVFPFPTIDPRYSGSVTIGADVIAMVKDTPAARSFLKYLAGAEAQKQWIALGGFTSVNRSVSPDTYSDPVARAVAEELTGPKVSRFGAGDLMPAAVQKAWWHGMVELVQHPDRLDSILASLTEAARTAR